MGTTLCTSGDGSNGGNSLSMSALGYISATPSRALWLTSWAESPSSACASTITLYCACINS
eukprot:12414410-Karenia_brevis.AAC.1